MDKTVIIINGTGGVGKDTICDVVARHYKTLNVSSIDPIKRIAHMGGWDYADKSPSARKLLSDIKRAFIGYNDLPTKYITEQYHGFLRDENRFLFVHIREPDEIEKFKHTVTSECYTLLVRAARAERPLGNASDDDVSNYAYDFTYANEKAPEELEADFMAFFEANVLRRK